MKAESDITRAAITPLEHIRHSWGESFVGTKEQLRMRGIGVGLVFPAMRGFMGRKLRCSHQSGLTMWISHHGRGRFIAQMHYRDNSLIDAARTRARMSTFAPGVALERCLIGCKDNYRGSCGALVKAGLVEEHHLPGQPGRPKTRVRYLPDGTQWPRENCQSISGPGTMWITRDGVDLYTVSIEVPEDERVRRESLWKQQRAEDDLANASARREYLATEANDTVEP